MIIRNLLRGVAAGAAGTSALNAATHLDMVIRGRPTSPMPERAVEELAKRTGTEIPGSGDARDNRVQGLGALSGIATGMAVGVAGVLLGPLLRRLPLPISGVALGAVAMAGSDVPMTRLGLTDPSSWSQADWLADAVPHLAYGVAAAWTLRATSGKVQP
jgi:hypothetical protein